MIASEWLAAVVAAGQLYFPDCSIYSEVIRFTRVKVRIEIGENIFADLFFREETNRTDYTLIVAGQRRYGIDNLGGWHEHPIEYPDQHVDLKEPVPDEALRRLRTAFDQTKVS
jgi:hypothetical protein